MVNRESLYLSTQASPQFNGNMSGLAAQPQHCSAQKQVMGRDDWALRCKHGLFLLPSWRGQQWDRLCASLYHSRLSLFSRIIYSPLEVAMSLLEKKKVQPVSSTVGSKCIYKYQCYLSNFSSTHFAIIQDEKPFSTMIWPQNFKELMSSWHGKNIPCPKINPWK